MSHAELYSRQISCIDMSAEYGEFKINIFTSAIRHI
jgi:hypothetical protein